MDQQVAARDKKWWEYYPLHKWWCNDVCPLVPRFTYRKGDVFNSNAYGLHWLIFTVWTLDNFYFGVDAEISFDGLYVGFIFPYLRVIIGVRHAYWNCTNVLQQLLRRKPALKNEKGEYN